MGEEPVIVPISTIRPHDKLESTVDETGGGKLSRHAMAELGEAIMPPGLKEDVENMNNIFGQLNDSGVDDEITDNTKHAVREALLDFSQQNPDLAPKNAREIEDFKIATTVFTAAAIDNILTLELFDDPPVVSIGGEGNSEIYAGPDEKHGGWKIELDYKVLEDSMDLIADTERYDADQRAIYKSGIQEATAGVLYRYAKVNGKGKLPDVDEDKYKALYTRFCRVNRRSPENKIS